MGLLNKSRCYLIGQMQYKDGSTWRDYVQYELEELGIEVFNPYYHPFIDSKEENNNIRDMINSLISQEKYDEAAEIVKQIRAEDLRMVDISDFEFCYIDPLYPTVGAWEEFFWANRMLKPIFTVFEGGKKNTPIWIYGVIPHKYIYDTIDDALNMIKRIDNRTKEIDNKRWKILKKNIT